MTRHRTAWLGAFVALTLSAGLAQAKNDGLFVTISHSADVPESDNYTSRVSYICTGEGKTQWELITSNDPPRYCQDTAEVRLKWIEYFAGGGYQVAEIYEVELDPEDNGMCGEREAVRWTIFGCNGVESGCNRATLMGCWHLLD